MQQIDPVRISKDIYHIQNYLGLHENFKIHSLNLEKPEEDDSDATRNTIVPIREALPIFEDSQLQIYQISPPIYQASNDFSNFPEVKPTSVPDSKSTNIVSKTEMKKKVVEINDYLTFTEENQIQKGTRQKNHYRGGKTN